MAGVLGAGDFGGRGIVGQVQRHQRLERQPGRHGVQDTVPVGQGLIGGGHRRAQVRHDDGAGELAGAVRDDRA